MLECPPDVQQKIERGRARMRELAPMRTMCLRFQRGDTYVRLNHENQLVVTPTQTSVSGRGRPPHRARFRQNILIDPVESLISLLTQRVPSYEVMPTSMDADRVAAARIAQQVAYYGYDKWNVKNITERVLRYAVVADEGFAWPYFDNTVGTPIGDGMHTGEVKIRVFGPNEVYWEPGVRFEDARWYAVEQARPLEDVYQLPNFLEGTKLVADADQSSVLGEAQKKGKNLVLVTEFLERPCPKYPLGRRMILANGQVIAEPENYPCADGDGQVVDEPVLHKLEAIIDPDSDRDQGLVRHAVDAVRIYQDAGNKILEWKNLALNPQVIIRNGKMQQRLTDEPGAVYTVMGNADPVWRQVPPIPRELFDIRNEQLAFVANLFARNEIPSQVESGRGIEALIEKDRTRQASLIGRLAEFHSRLMRHCLYLVQRHYSEARLLQVRGEFGVDPIKDFKGTDLLGETDIRVAPGSIEPRTREWVEKRIMWIAQTFPGWMSPEAALAALNGGTAERLVDDYEKDVARANKIIQRLKLGPEALFAEQPIPSADPEGEPEQSSWMPRPFDNIHVHKQVFESFLKSDAFDTLRPEMKQAAMEYYNALLELEAQQQAAQAAAQMEQAQGLGAANAARPGEKPMPSLPSFQ